MRSRNPNYNVLVPPMKPSIKLPQYNGKNFPTINLQYRAYEAQDLYNRVSQLFQKPDFEISVGQTMAKSALIKLYERCKEDFNDHGTHIGWLKSQLESFMHLLDEFFFCKALTRKDNPLVRRLYVFKQRQDATPRWSYHPERIWRGRIKYLWDKSKPICEIALIAVDQGCPRALKGLIVTLVHELVHAYIRIFCSHKPSDNIFLTDHGLLWNNLFGLIATTMRDWHEDLWDFGGSDYRWGHRGKLPQPFQPSWDKADGLKHVEIQHGAIHKLDGGRGHRSKEP